MSDAQKVVLVERDLPDPEVTPKAKRRIFNAAYKKKILTKVAAAAGSGNTGEILRREGIYSSTLTGWRKEREAAVDAAFSQKRGPEPKHNPLAGENEKLRRRNQRLEEELRKAELIIEVPQKTVTAAGTAAGAAAGQRELLMAAVEELRFLDRRAARLSESLHSPVECVSTTPASSFSCACAAVFGAPLESRRKVNRLAFLVWRFYMKSAFKDCSPAQLCASLLDDGQYHDPLEIASNRQG